LKKQAYAIYGRENLTLIYQYMDRISHVSDAATIYGIMLSEKEKIEKLPSAKDLISKVYDDVGKHISGSRSKADKANLNIGLNSSLIDEHNSKLLSLRGLGKNIKSQMDYDIDSVEKLESDMLNLTQNIKDIKSATKDIDDCHKQNVKHSETIKYNETYCKFAADAFGIFKGELNKNSNQTPGETPGNPEGKLVKGKSTDNQIN